MFCALKVKDSKANSSETTTNLECETWKNEHIFLAQDVHFYNKTFAFVKIDTSEQLNINTQCQPTEYDIEVLKIFAKKPILLDNDLNLTDIVTMFNRTYVDVVFQNVKGFNKNHKHFDKINQKSPNKIRSIQMNNVIVDFYLKGNLLSNKNCSSENFDANTNYFGRINTLLLLGSVIYNNPICPFVFLNTKLQQLHLCEISNSLLFRNRLEFLDINETKTFKKKTKSLNFLTLDLYSDVITLNNLNPFVFKSLKYLLLQGNLASIDKNLFENFKEISSISINSDTLIDLFHGGTK